VHDVSLTVATASSSWSPARTVGEVLVDPQRAGMVPLRAGSVRLDGVDARSCGEWHARRQAARMCPSAPRREVPAAGPRALASSGSDAAADATRLGLGGLVERPFTTLSGGQLQRAYLARAVGSLATGRHLLLADEPTSALDFAGQDDVAQLLADLAVDRLVVSHDAAVVRHADRVLEMAGGSLRERGA
jgi:ABC-type dipeptide/oligopeptide/nickel transport system ATPase subunit